MWVLKKKDIVCRLLINVRIGPTASSSATDICGKLSDTFTCIMTCFQLLHHLNLEYDITLHSVFLEIKAHNPWFMFIISG